MQNNLAEIDLSEIEDLANPKDELEKKIVSLATTIREWKNETTRVRRTVKEQFVEILDLGLNKYKMEKTALRRLVIDIFRIHDVSDSWLRKLLPEGLKDTSKTRISYQQKQEIEKERQRLLQERVLGSKHDSEIHDLSGGSTAEPDSFQPLEPETTQSSSKTGYIDHASKYHSQDQDTRSSPSYSNESIELQSELSEAYKKIEKLEADVQRLSEQFIAKANLQAYSETFPLVAHIDPVKKNYHTNWI